DRPEKERHHGDDGQETTQTVEEALDAGGVFIGCGDARAAWALSLRLLGTFPGRGIEAGGQREVALVSHSTSAREQFGLRKKARVDVDGRRHRKARRRTAWRRNEFTGHRHGEFTKTHLVSRLQGKATGDLSIEDHPGRAGKA